VKTSLISIRGQ